ncbi:MAG: acyltransferase [Reichenbachiella sp.]|uniref:acyltransferase family protein n=1 Tax=Reichenbachiella sp. TaxID=2184521 RepID=UPI002965DF28|nr:acyltransferase [Reichenbachiella sp.]MDW3208242.1 acyltransferase [Reichenbachiella sp.]
MKSLSKSLARTTSGRYINQIDGLRFIAIFPVLLHHLAERIYRAMSGQQTLNDNDVFLYQLLPSGRLGVEIFFVISGFVISMPLLKNWINTKNVKFSYRRYLLKRITRLEPPYLLIMASSFILLFLLNQLNIDFSGGTRSFSSNSLTLTNSFIASLFYGHGIIYNSFPKLNPPAWSLEIEFQFYLIAPILILLSISIANKLPRKDYIVIILLLMIFTIKLIGSSFIPLSLQKYYITNYFEFFILGFIFSFFYFTSFFQNILLKRSSSLVFVFGIILAYVGDHYRLSKEGWNSIYDFFRILGIFLIFFGSFSGGLGQKFTEKKWISILGGMCYSIYLIHLFIFQVGVSIMFKYLCFGSFALNLLTYSIILIPLTFIASAAFFILVEKPCMNPDWYKLLIKKFKHN